MIADRCCGWRAAPALCYPAVSNQPGRSIFYTDKLLPELRDNPLFTSLAGEHLERVVLQGARGIARIERW